MSGSVVVTAMRNYDHNDGVCGCCFFFFSSLRHPGPHGRFRNGKGMTARKYG